MKKYGVLIIVLALVQGVNGQFWVDKQEDTVTNLYQADAEFQNFWKGKEYTRGEGYKQHKRWKNFWEPRLFPSGDFSQLASDYFISNTNNSQQKTSDKNFGNWESLGIDSWVTHSYNPGNGRVNCVFQDPNDENVIYIGSASGGLWKTTNQGDTWVPLTDQIPTLGISGIAVDYSNPEIIYIATGDSEHFDVYGVGVLKSVDGGTTWSTTGLAWSVTEERSTVKLIMHPSNPLVLFCGTTDGLMKTINGGLTWELVLTGNIKDVEFKPTDPTVVYCSKKRLYKSVDEGNSFEIVNDSVLPTSPLLSLSKIAVTPANPEVVYLFCADVYYGFQGLYKSTDSGNSWALQSNTPNVLKSTASGDGLGGQAWYDMAIAVSPVDEDIVVVGGVNLWKSTNSGVSWVLNSYWFYEPGMTVNYVHPDIHHLEYVGENLYCGSDGGIYHSTDNSVSYEDLSSGLVITQFTKLGVSHQNSSLIIAGSQDNGTNILRQTNWDHVNGGDGGECVYLPSDSNVVFCSTQNGGIRKSINGGIIFTPSDIGISEDGAWVTPFVISPLNDDYIYGAFQNVWRSTSQGDSWTKISDINDFLHAIAIGMNNPNKIYTSTYDDLYRTDDGGNVWEIISSGLPNVAITGIAIDPLNVDHVWVTFSGFSDGNKVFYSSDSGEEWINITDNLPNVPVNCIVFDDQGDNGVYIGTDTGIFYTNDNLAHWEPFMNNFPNVIVTELEVHDEDQLIFASTFGRGIWKSTLFEISEAPIVNFTLSRSVICEGMNVDFYDNSSLGASGWSWTFEGAVSTTSSEMNPSITYENAGEFDVSLTINNEIGETTMVLENVVEVVAQNAIPIPYEQDFESSMELDDMSWYSLDENGWELAENTGISGTQSMWVENYQLDSNDEYEIFSKPIFLNASQAYFMFQYSYARIDASNNDALRLYSSINCGDTWSLVNLWSAPFSLLSSGFNLEPYFPQNSSDWQQVVVELNESLLGQDVMFKFRFLNDYGNNIFIDDINISSVPISVSESELIDKIIIFPNPVKNLLFIQGLKQNDCLLEVYNSLGMLIEVFPLSNVNENVFDMSAMKNGLYVYKIINKKKELLDTGKINVIK